MKKLFLSLFMFIAPLCNAVDGLQKAKEEIENLLQFCEEKSKRITQDGLQYPESLQLAQQFVDNENTQNVIKSTAKDMLSLVKEQLSAQQALEAAVKKNRSKALHSLFVKTVEQCTSPLCDRDLLTKAIDACITESIIQNVSNEIAVQAEQ